MKRPNFFKVLWEVFCLAIRVCTTGIITILFGWFLIPASAIKEYIARKEKYEREGETNDSRR